jgi:hypothetical protein
MTVRRADDTTYTLATNASENGAAIAIKGGEYCFMAEGTAGGATISLQIQTPNNSWSDVTVFSGQAVKSTTLPFSQTGIDLPAGNVRMGATGGMPNALYASLVALG